MGRTLCPFLTPLQNQVRCNHHHHRHHSYEGSLYFREQVFVGNFRPASLCCLCVGSDESGPDDGAAKANPSLTREKDLVVNISDLDNIFDEDDEELGVRRPCLHTLNRHSSISEKLIL